MDKDTSDFTSIEQGIFNILKAELRRGKTLQEAREEMKQILSEAERRGTEAAIRDLVFKEVMGCPTKIACGCGQSFLVLSGRWRKRELDLSCGTILFHRPYYAPLGLCGCPGRHPVDEKLGLSRGPLSEDIVKSLCLLAVMVPFERSTDLMQRLLGLEVSKKRAVTVVGKVARSAYEQQTERALRRWEAREEMVATRPSSGRRRGRLFVIPDGTNVGIQKSEEFRECKSAILFWEHDLKPRRYKKGRRRQPQQITKKLIVSHVGSHEEFLPYLWDAFVEMGGLTASEVIWIADGIDWVWNDSLRMLPPEHFDVIELLDWYHLFQNLWKAARVMTEDAAEQQRWVTQIKRQMRKRNTGRDLALELAELAEREPDPDKHKILENVYEYVDGHKNRMRYADFRSFNWPRGSAAIESVQHSVIQARFKLPGMRWTVVGVNCMLRLRNAYFSNRWDEVFEQAFAPFRHVTPQSMDNVA